MPLAHCRAMAASILICSKLDKKCTTSCHSSIDQVFLGGNFYLAPNVRVKCSTWAVIAAANVVFISAYERAPPAHKARAACCPLRFLSNPSVGHADLLSHSSMSPIKRYILFNWEPAEILLLGRYRDGNKGNGNANISNHPLFLHSRTLSLSDNSAQFTAAAAKTFVGYHPQMTSTPRLGGKSPLNLSY